MRLAPAVGFVAILAVALAALAQNEKDSSRKPPPKDYSFRVRASSVWTDTGLDLEPGDRIHITGAVTTCEGGSPSEKAHLPLPSAPGGALLVKLHAEANPILASPDADLPIIGASHLYLGVNGWQCHGIIATKVQVQWHKPPSPKP
jgi:hypothetical protein